VEQGIDFEKSKRRAKSGHNIRQSSGMRHSEVSNDNNMQIIEEMHQMAADDIEITRTVKVTPYVVNMAASSEEFNKHVSDCNLDFKENVMRKVQTIKLKDTADLNKKVEELKIQEASELQYLNKEY